MYNILFMKHIFSKEYTNIIIYIYIYRSRRNRGNCMLFSPPQMCMPQMCPPQMCPPQMCPPQMCPPQICPPQMCPPYNAQSKESKKTTLTNAECHEKFVIMFCV